MIKSLLSLEKPVVLIVTCNPLDATLFPNASSIVTTFSPTVSSLQAVCNQLKDK
ncbi:hypothetical protein H0X48_05935 [Candidatus Dependentiae bacterium]|nr:hypothetical protein [Candidatus Dependentiae bacterium]